MDRKSIDAAKKHRCATGGTSTKSKPTEGSHPRWSQSELLYEALNSVGTLVRFHTLEGAGHGDGFGGPELETMVRDFFEKNLKDETRPQEPTASTTRSPAVMPQPIPWEVIRQREDADNDNLVTRSEFKGPPPMFIRLDKNRDGVLTKDDFETVRK